MKNWLWLSGALLLTLPGLYLRLGGFEASSVTEAAIFGAAILGAAFLLSWAAEAAQVEISQSLVLALIALIAVLPEYAVDLYFAWGAGQNPDYAPFATANMTGANRLLVGVGWALVVFLFWFKTKRRTLEVERTHSIELSFLVLATLYAFTIPLKGSLHLVDSLVLISLFGLYMWAVSRTRVVEPEVVGPARAIASLPRVSRRVVTISLFLFSGLVIVLAAEPFAEGLIETGRRLALEQFILVQWVAPLASEAPEIIIASIFALRGQPGWGLGVLIASKVNQWTLLVGTLPLVYSFSLGQPGALPLDSRQVEEFLLTAAQSAFAIAILAHLRISLREAGALFFLFVTQLFFFAPAVRYGYSAVYLALTLALLLGSRERLRGILKMVPQTLRGLRAPP